MFSIHGYEIHLLDFRILTSSQGAQEWPRRFHPPCCFCQPAATIFSWYWRFFRNWEVDHWIWWLLGATHQSRRCVTWGVFFSCPTFIFFLSIFWQAKKYTANETQTAMLGHYIRSWVPFFCSSCFVFNVVTALRQVRSKNTRKAPRTGWRILVQLSRAT